ncbi:MAG TPA: hypothetical protein DD414_03165 [Lachnospiraceae bacterium]|nr:hypothetical protein [Lachnospiraceae bacterium]
MQEGKKGGLHYGYVVVAGVFLLMFPMSFILNAASIFYTPVSEELGITQTAFGLHITITTATMALMLPTVNKLFRTYDTRITITACMILEAAAYLVNSRAQSVWVFYIDAFILGCCESLLIYLLIPVLVNNWFIKNNGLWIGVCGAAQGIAAGFFNTFGASVIANYGWRTCYMVWAAVCLVVGIPVSLLMIRYRPEDKGLKPVGYESAGQADAGAKVSGVNAQKALKTAAFYIVAFCPLLMAFGCNINFYFNSFYLSIGMTTIMAGTAASAVMFGNMFGKLSVGIVADFNPKAAVFYGAGAGVIAMPLFILIAPKVMWMAWVAAFLFGITYGSCNTLGPILVKNEFGNKDFGAIWAQASRLQSIFVAMASVIWGLIVENTGYTIGMWIAFVLFVIAIILGLKSTVDVKKMKELWTES